MIGIISAMREEIQALLNELKNVETVKKGMRTYYTGTLFNKPVVLAFSRWGKVAAAATTTQILNDYPLKELIFTGVAGAINNNLNIGDIVIGKQLFQYDMDASPLYEQFEIPILKIKGFKTKNAETLLKATTLFLTDYLVHINSSYAQEFEISNPKVVFEDIASGDQFISSKTKIKELNKLLPNAFCVEMEGAAVAQVCYEYQMPFSIIRIISDKANGNANIDFPKFANSIASNYALGIFKKYFEIIQ